MITSDIDLPAKKQLLWHELRDDLKRYIPEIVNDFLLLCPTCCRLLPFENFTLEHIIPRQSLLDDPIGAKEHISSSSRSGVTLICNKELIIKGKTAYRNGCNSWKGRFYDRPLREIFNGRAASGRNFSSRHHVALSISCFLGLFAKYGFQVVLSNSGLTMRRQFFSPNSFIKDIPIEHQIALMGAPPEEFDIEHLLYWLPPFKFEFEERAALVVVRNASMRIPISRNPELPLAVQLRYAPPKYKLRPNFETVFQ